MGKKHPEKKRKRETAEDICRIVDACRYLSVREQLNLQLVAYRLRHNHPDDPEAEQVREMDHAS